MNYELEQETKLILGTCFEVMNELGEGFLESVYRNALAIALEQKGFQVKQEYPLSVFFRGQEVGTFFADLLVDGKMILELKTVKTLQPEHQAQVINYLKATGLRVGLLINFGKRRIEFHRLYNQSGNISVSQAEALS